MKNTLVVTAIAAALTFSGVAAYAAIPDAGGTVHGCRSNLTHILTIRDPVVQPSCQPLNTPVDFAAEGPEGPQGPAGPAGATGPTGPGSTLYEVSTAIPIEAGSTVTGGEVLCNTSDRAISGGWSFHGPNLSQTPALNPPHHISVSLNRPNLPQNSLFHRWQITAEHDPYVINQNGQASLVIYATCAHLV